VTIGLSTYLIYNSRPVFERLAPLLRIFERKQPTRGAFDLDELESPEVLVVGVGRFGGALVTRLLAHGRRVMAVDFDPEALGEWDERGLPTMYGDAEDHELANVLPLSKTRWVVCSIRRREANLALFHGLRHHGYGGRVALSAETDLEAAILEQTGADLVLRPLMSAAEQAAELFDEQME
jgi:Trk K+ transport system NAD-binding subunit